MDGGSCPEIESADVVILVRSAGAEATRELPILFGAGRIVTAAEHPKPPV